MLCLQNFHELYFSSVDSKTEIKKYIYNYIIDNKTPGDSRIVGL